jgi:iron complex outermembrane receptor protein
VNRATNVNANAVFNTRLPGAPERSFNLWNKYTFTEGGLSGLTVGGGLRHRSEINIAQARDWDASRGGLTAGDYTVFDAMLGYNTEIWGMQTNFTLNVTNLTDKLHSEGGWNYARGREIALTTRLTF